MSIVFLLIAAMLMTGTFAWQSVSQQALNQAIGGYLRPRDPNDPAGGRLHDDFEEVDSNAWRRGATVANKDVYVENFERHANYGQPIFVRLRLYEYMEFGDGAWLQPGNAERRVYPAANYNVRPLVPGTRRDDFNTWTPRLSWAPELTGGTANTTADPFRRYWNWDMGGSKVYMPTFNRDPMSLMSDVKGAALDPQGGTAQHSPPSGTWTPITEPDNPTRRGATHGYPVEAGNDHNFWSIGDTWDAQMKYWDAAANAGAGGHAITSYTVRHTARRTLNARVLTMEQWINGVPATAGQAAIAPRTTGHFWVVDVDGWAYWAAPLEPETATGLLLDAIRLHNVPEERWYYAIFVDAEFATAEQWYRDAANRGWFHSENPDSTSPRANLHPSYEATRLMEQISWPLIDWPTGDMPTAPDYDDYDYDEGEGDPAAEYNEPAEPDTSAEQEAPPEAETDTDTQVRPQADTEAQPPPEPPPNTVPPPDDFGVEQ